ncbi:hypothetical protein KEM52_002968, partial [Ascosphaera acerosa]
LHVLSYTAGVATCVLIVYCVSIGLDSSLGVAWGVRAMMSLASIAWMALTWMFFSGIRGLVSRITATVRTVPRAPRAAPARRLAPPSRQPQAQAPASALETQTQLEVRVRSALPFRRDRVYTVSPERVRLAKSLSPPPAHLRTRAEQEAYDEMVRSLQEEERVRRTSFWAAPLRKTSFACHSVLRNTRYAFTKELMVRLYVEERAGAESAFKLDTTGKFSAAEWKLLEEIITRGF